MWWDVTVVLVVMGIGVCDELVTPRWGAMCRLGVWGREWTQMLFAAGSDGLEVIRVNEAAMVLSVI